VQLGVIGEVEDSLRWVGGCLWVGAVFSGVTVYVRSPTDDDADTRRRVAVCMVLSVYRWVSVGRHHAAVMRFTRRQSYDHTYP